MEQSIEKAEAEAAGLQLALEDPSIASDAERLSEIYAELEDARAKIAQLYERWAELESRRAAQNKE
jgi:ATP-binding cassette subfamily F protein uup